MKSLWRPVSIVLAYLVLVSSANGAQLKADLSCEAPQFSEKQIQKIVQRERFVRHDLPPQVNKHATPQIRRQRCHYVYIETPVGAGTDDDTIVVLDQFGVIVDATVGRGNPYGAVECPKRTLTAEEVKQFVDQERARYADLPAAAGEFTSRVTQKRCMYVYYEVVDSNNTSKGSTLSFTVDQYGAVFTAYKQENN